jgi:hypothetical protein
MGFVSRIRFPQVANVGCRRKKGTELGCCQHASRKAGGQLSRKRWQRNDPWSSACPLVGLALTSAAWG